jgi:hypothetical protein
LVAVAAGFSAVLFMLGNSGQALTAAFLLVLSCITATLLGRVMRVIGRRRQAGVQARASAPHNSADRARLLYAARRYYPDGRLLRLMRIFAVLGLLAFASSAAVAAFLVERSAGHGWIVGLAVAGTSYVCWLIGAYASSRDDFSELGS